MEAAPEWNFLQDEKFNEGLRLVIAQGWTQLQDFFLTGPQQVLSTSLLGELKQTNSLS